MIVTIKQYNSVVDGLRTQLMLLKQLNQENLEISEHRLKHVEAQAKQLQELIDEKEELRQSLDKLGRDRDELAHELFTLKRKKGKR